jgi:Tol biopolymer transport system component
MKRSRTLTLATAAILSCAVVAGVAWFHAGRNDPSAATKPAWLVIASSRDGESNEGYGAESRAYSIRPDGSRLTRLLDEDRELVPIGVSADGSAIAFAEAEYPRKTLYVSRADGTALHRVLHVGHGGTFESAVFSPNGKEIAITTTSHEFNGRPSVAVVGNDGRRLWDGQGASPDWSRDGRRLVFATARGCAVAVEPFDREPVHVRGLCGVPKWSPDGKRFAYETKGGCKVVTAPESDRLQRWLQDLQGERRVFIPGRCRSPQWSPNGRWIAFATAGCPLCDSEKAVRAARKHLGMWVIRPNGEDRHRIGPVDEDSGAAYSWSPDGERLAFTDGYRFFVAHVPDHATRLRVRISPTSAEAAPLWSADGSEVRLAAREGDDPSQIWTLRPDGSDLRRVTNVGDNELVGEAAVAPTRAPATPLPWSERVLGPKTVETRRPVGMIAADGGRVAYQAGTTKTDCEHVSIWAPALRSLVRSTLATPCGDQEPSVYELALAGSLVGWSTVNGCSPSNCDVVGDVAALPRLRPVLIGADEGSDGSDQGGQLTSFGFAGHGDVFVDYNGVRVETAGGTIRRCKLHRDGLVRSVSGHLIAVHARAAVAVLDDRCSLVRLFPFASGEIKRTLLDGRQLVVSRSGSIEAYDVETGRLVARRTLPRAYKLSDAAGGIALLFRGRSIRLLRLADGRMVTFTPCRGPVHADIERFGLYYAYATPDRHGRLVLVARRELERRLLRAANYEPRCLRSANEYRTGRDVHGLAAGDLNRDGRLDLVTAGAQSGGSVSVLLNQGHGKFPTKRVYRTHGLPLALSIGDLNGDGRPDVVTANGDAANEVSVLHNQGHGTFGPVQGYQVGPFASEVAIGDLNGDGRPDLAVADDNKAVSVLLNTGKGSFGPKVAYPAGKLPYALAIADVDRDGSSDLVVAHSDTAAVSMLQGKGDGTFGRARTYAAGEPFNQTALAIGDLDRDGRLDVVTVAGCGVSELPGRVEGVFGAVRDLAQPEDCPGRLALGDLDGDGRPDLVTAGYAGYASYTNGFSSSVSVFLNRAGASLGTPANYEAGPAGEAAGLVIGDLNGDGRPDLAAASAETDTVSVLINTLGVCRVRGFRDKTLAAAKALLVRSGCRVGRITRVPSMLVPRGHVLAPEPRFGAFWPNGPEVDLVVSLGPRR